MKNRNGILLGLRAIGNVGLCATHTGTASPDAGAGGIGDLSRDFDYDALYRLLYATGRENQPTSTNPYFNRERSHTASSTNNYSQKYSYDQMGNILKLKHENTDSGPGNFVRTFNDGLTYGSTNKLASVTIGGGTPWGFTYDGCGNQTQQTIDRNMQWDYADRLYSFYIQTGTAEPSQYVQYCYDASGHRVMKISRVQGGNGYFKTRIYIGAIFEEYYEVDQFSVNQGYQDEIMVMDNQSKVASDVIGTSYPHDKMGVKYVFPDHLGSSNVQCDDSGGLINREEYYPFGETSFGSYGKKRYRYCGKERDEESGLYYYGARYYLPWTCRFVSVDPKADHTPFHSCYMYAHDNPLMYSDPTGEQGEKKDSTKGHVKQPKTHQVKSKSHNHKNLIKEKDSGQKETLLGKPKQMPESLRKQLYPTSSNNIVPEQETIVIPNHSGSKNVAERIIDSRSVKFLPFHVGGNDNKSTAEQNIHDAAEGKEVFKSDFGHLPGKVNLDDKMLKIMFALSTKYSFEVTEIAGGKHTKKIDIHNKAHFSKHYYGWAFDVDKINGIAVNKDNPYFKQFMVDAKKLGAVLTLGPGSDKNHKTHVHIQSRFK